ncbi:MAG: acyl carrier protein [Lachnospiraceae bacterium]|nr:acyl carrier protein [Lachnospiraceae bacterium]
MEFEKIRDIVAEVMNMEAEEITMESTFVDDLGCDSLDIQQILLAVQTEFDVKIPDNAVDGMETIGDVVEQLKQR